MNSTDFAIALLIAANFAVGLSLILFHGIELRALYISVTAVCVTMLVLGAIAIVRGRMQ